MTNPLNDLYTLPFEGNLHDGTIILLPYRIDTWEDGGKKAFNEFKEIIFAISSTIAVLPTAAGPIKIGLFFFLLRRISIVFFISLSRPITGSIFPSLASFVKSRPNSSNSNFFFLNDLLIF